MSKLNASLFPPNWAIRHYLRIGYAALTAIFFLTITLIWWLDQEKQNAGRIQATLNHDANEIASSIQISLKQYEQVLRAVKGLMEGPDDVSPAEFHTFVTAQKIEQSTTGLQGVALVLNVPQSEKDKHIEKIRGLGISKYEIHPRGDRTSYAPIVYVEPPNSANAKVIGLDILSVPAANIAATKARDTSEVTVTEMLTLGQDAEGSKLPGFVMYLPIYRNTGSQDTVQARRTNLLGWADAPFHARDLFVLASHGLEDGIRLQIFDGEVISAAHRSFGILNGKESSFQEILQSQYQINKTIEYGGRKWTLILEPTEIFLTKHQLQLHHFFALVGTALSLTVSMIVWLLMSAHDRAKDIAIQMTGQLRELSSEMEDTLNAIPDLLFELTLDGKYLGYRAHRLDMLAESPDGFLGKTLFEVLPMEAANTCLAALVEANSTGFSSGQQIKLPIRGTEKWFELSVAKRAVEGASVPRFVMLSREITQRKKAEEKVERLAYWDPLTQLPNRTRFFTIAKNTLVEAYSKRVFGACILIDLDHFKSINDNWGHRIGDTLLVNVAGWLRQSIAEHHLVARLGGDEFAVILSNLGSDPVVATTMAQDICANVLTALTSPCTIEGREHHTSASIGIALFGDSPLGVDEVLSRADAAMYQAKADGRNTFHFFDFKLQSELTSKAELEADLRLSLTHRELELAYQPQVDKGGRIIGVEALLRWSHPQRGPVSPAEFIPLAESNGFILSIGQWVLQTACTTLSEWSRNPKTAELSMAVNVSARQFHHPDFVTQVMTSIISTGANPRKLKLELTESVLAQDLDAIVRKMDYLKLEGITFSLDDFGTGYSSLRYLKSLPLDQLKIDQSFVRDIMQDTSDAAIVRTVIALGDLLGLGVIAEGVETEAQRSFLESNGCFAYQGYLFSRPLSFNTVTYLIENWPISWSNSIGVTS